ncbi:MAG: translation initiation factor IF-3 [Candidatus Goldbacteria bacterium]|nr:translation initiation factor IF-3 [Candidatus Goldiibacteriota bacterium]
MSFNELRVNNEIPAKEVRVVDENGNSLGIMATVNALKIADDKGLDLVEISPTANPPVCKLMNYSKYKYEQIKKEKVAKKKQHTIVVKEIQIRLNINIHDLEIKLRHAMEFLDKSHRVKFVIKFHGRDGRNEYKETKGQEICKKIIEYLAGKGEMEKEPVRDEQSITFLMMPLKKK